MSDAPAPDFLDLPERTTKPRRAGITHVLDRGMSPLALESLLETAGAHIDLIKLGWGTAYVSKGVREKVELCRQAGVRICPGGTLLEIAVHQGVLDRYAEWLRGLGIDHVEVSNGSLPISAEREARDHRRARGGVHRHRRGREARRRSPRWPPSGSRRCSATSRPARCG